MALCAADREGQGHCELYLTEEGRSLHQRLMAPQMTRVKQAIAHAGADSGPVMQQLLYGLVNVQDRDQVERIVTS